MLEEGMQGGGPPETLQGLATSIQAFADHPQLALMQDGAVNSQNIV